MASYVNLEGMLFPVSFPKENYYLVRNLPLRCNDVVVSAYPKSGSNWVAYIVYCILHPDEPNPSVERVRDFLVYVDSAGLKTWKDCPEDTGRAFVTHLPLDHLQWNPHTKFVGVVRNPFDSCVSFYHFQKQLPFSVETEATQQEIPPEFFTQFINGTVFYGDHFKHLKSLYERKDEPNVHLVVFEKLKANPKQEIQNLARFLGKEEDLLADDGKPLDRILEQSSFASMKRNLVYRRLDGKAVDVLRKGEVGGYRQSLTADQISSLQEKLEKEMGGTEIVDFWRNV